MSEETKGATVLSDELIGEVERAVSDNVIDYEQIAALIVERNKLQDECFGLEDTNSALRAQVLQLRAELAAAQAEAARLQALWDGVPWDDIRDAAYGMPEAEKRTSVWWRANNPRFNANAPQTEEASK